MQEEDANVQIYRSVRQPRAGKNLKKKARKNGRKVVRKQKTKIRAKG